MNNLLEIRTIRGEPVSIVTVQETATLGGPYEVIPTWDGFIFTLTHAAAKELLDLTLPLNDIELMITALALRCVDDFRYSH